MNLDYLLGGSGHASQPLPSRTAPTVPAPAPQISPSLLAYAARDAVRDVLPADWQLLPDGTDTANVLAGTIANHYAVQQQAQAERLAATRNQTNERTEDQEHGVPPEAEGPSPLAP